MRNSVLVGDSLGCGSVVVVGWATGPAQNGRCDEFYRGTVGVLTSTELTPVRLVGLGERSWSRGAAHGPRCACRAIRFDKI